jgi:hypothetical protein
MKIALKPKKLDAVRALVGHGISGDDNATDVNYRGKTSASQSDIDAKYAEMLAEYKTKQYQRDRAESYDPIPEQLDMIYHDMDGWKAKIKAVKDKFPKPT